MPSPGMISMTELGKEIEDLIDAHNRIYALRQEVHNWLPPPEFDKEFNKLSKALIHISAALDILTGKTKIPEFPVKMELLGIIKMERGYFTMKCFFQCPICKTMKICDYVSEIPDPVICEECDKELSNVKEIEYLEI